MTKLRCYYTSPVGQLTIETTDSHVLRIAYCDNDAQHGKTSSPLQEHVIRTLDDYFQKPEVQIDFPIELTGTPFQRRIWTALRKIPCGITKTYGELANELDTSARAIGNACRQNPITILIPCHRVTAKENIGGYSGHTAGHILDRKKWLLAHEMQVIPATPCLTED